MTKRKIGITALTVLIVIMAGCKNPADDFIENPVTENPETRNVENYALSKYKVDRNKEFYFNVNNKDKDLGLLYGAWDYENETITVNEDNLFSYEQFDGSIFKEYNSERICLYDKKGNPLFLIPHYEVNGDNLLLGDIVFINIESIIESINGGSNKSPIQTVKEYNYLKIWDTNNPTRDDLIQNGFTEVIVNNSEFTSGGKWENENGELFVFTGIYKYWNSSNKGGERDYFSKIEYKAPPNFTGGIDTFYKNTGGKEELLLCLKKEGSNTEYEFVTRYFFKDCDSNINGYYKELRLGKDLEVRFVKRTNTKPPVFDY